jgi:hypothetical protein
MDIPARTPVANAWIKKFRISKAEDAVRNAHVRSSRNSQFAFHNYSDLQTFARVGRLNVPLSAHAEVSCGLSLYDKNFSMEFLELVNNLPSSRAHCIHNSFHVFQGTGFYF